MLDYRKPKTCAAAFFAPPLIDTVEPLKYPRLRILRNPYAGIRNRKKDAVCGSFGTDNHAASGLIVADAVIRKIVDKLLKPLTAA